LDGRKVCPKCGGEMKAGKTYPGKFKEPIRFGGFPEKRGVLTYTSKEKVEVVAYACKKCGYIECDRKLQVSLKRAQKF